MRLLLEAMHNPSKATKLITETKFFKLPLASELLDENAVDVTTVDLSSTLSQFERRMYQQE